MTVNSTNTSRFGTACIPAIAEGWVLERLTSPSRLHGANGIRDGADGRLYVAQCIGSQIGVIDLDSGTIETISPMGGNIIGPDDLAFDAVGNLYITECMNARVSIIDAHGRTKVLRGDLPGANGITFYKDRLFVDECRLGGRLLELDLSGGEPRVLLEGLDLPNALDTGPDGLLYFPLVGANEIWRIHPDGGNAELVADGLRNPVAVKFDSKGRIVSPQSRTGEVLRIDPRTGHQEVFAKLAPGIDNLAFLGDRLFVSHHTTGQISEIGSEGSVREIVDAGFMFPLDVAGDRHGRIVISDNSTIYQLMEDDTLSVIGRVFEPGYPGSTRGIAVGPDSLMVTTTDGRLAAYYPRMGSHNTLLTGLEEPCGVDVDDVGHIWVVEKGGGRVLRVTDSRVETLASSLSNPMGIAIGADGCYVSEGGTGRILKLMGAGTRLVAESFVEPHGIVALDTMLYVVDAGDRSVWAVDTVNGERQCIARNLPIGAPTGVTPKPLLGMPPLSGPFGPFAGIAIGAGRSLCFSADGEGSLMRLRPFI